MYWGLTCSGFLRSGKRRQLGSKRQKHCFLINVLVKSFSVIIKMCKMGRDPQNPHGF